MIEIKSQIISRQLIKPSTVTPSDSKTFKLSLLDQLSPDIHGNMTFFYPSNDTTLSIDDKSNLLRDSISKTLFYFYPLGGRLRDAATIDCNDEGAFFVESKVNIELSRFLDRPDFDTMEHFLATSELSNCAMFIVRFTAFTCGGVAISLSLTHKFFDVSAVLTLLRTWSSICRGSGDPVTPILVGEKFLAPRDELSSVSASVSASVNIPGEKFVQRRFVFRASKIEELKARVEHEYRKLFKSDASRVEVVLGLLWKCAVSVKKQKTGSSFEPTALFQAVNLRKRMSPPLPETTIGNFIWPFMVIAHKEQDLELHEVVIQMRTCLNEFNNTKAKMFTCNHDGDDDGDDDDVFAAIMEAIKERGEFLRNNKGMRVYKCSSWCKFPLYEIDFGWGEPIWHASVNKLVSNTIALTDTLSGDGVEVWITLDEEEMELFEQNEELLKYSTLNPSVLV